MRDYRGTGLTNNLLQIEVTGKTDAEAVARAKALAEAFVADHAKRIQAIANANAKGLLDQRDRMQVELADVNKAIGGRSPDTDPKDAANLESLFARRAELTSQISDFGQRAEEARVGAPQLVAGDTDRGRPARGAALRAQGRRHQRRDRTRPRALPRARAGRGRRGGGGPPRAAPGHRGEPRRLGHRGTAPPVGQAVAAPTNPGGTRTAHHDPCPHRARLRGTAVAAGTGLRAQHERDRPGPRPGTGGGRASGRHRRPPPPAARRPPPEARRPHRGQRRTRRGRVASGAADRRRLGGARHGVDRPPVPRHPDRARRACRARQRRMAAHSGAATRGPAHPGDRCGADRPRSARPDRRHAVGRAGQRAARPDRAADLAERDGPHGSPNASRYGPHGSRTTTRRCGRTCVASQALTDGRTERQ